MPLAPILTAPRTLEFREYEEPPLRPNELRIRSILTAIKTGTEMTSYRGTTPFNANYFDSRERIFLPKGDGGSVYPSGVGNWGVGQVVEVGSEVKRFQVGDRVHGPFGHRPTHAVAESRLYPLGELTPTAALLVDPTEFALCIVHDAEVKVGDNVAIFGMGAIGLMAVQVAKLQGARKVIAIDLVNKRLEAARRLGADELLNPRHGDPGKVIKDLTGGKGVDVAIEISGSTHALQQCIRCVHVAGLVVAGAYYQGEATGLRLGEEWHHNRPTLKSSMAVWGCPHRWHPMWNEERLVETAVHLLESGKLKEEGIITHRFPLAEIVRAYELADLHPEEVIKAVITHP